MHGGSEFHQLWLEQEGGFYQVWLKGWILSGLANTHKGWILSGLSTTHKGWILSGHKGWILSGNRTELYIVRLKSICNMEMMSS